MKKAILNLVTWVLTLANCSILRSRRWMTVHRYFSSSGWRPSNLTSELGPIEEESVSEYQENPSFSESLQERVALRLNLLAEPKKAVADLSPIEFCESSDSESERLRKMGSNLESSISDIIRLYLSISSEEFYFRGLRKRQYLEINLDSAEIPPIMRPRVIDGDEMKSLESLFLENLAWNNPFNLTNEQFAKFLFNLLSPYRNNKYPLLLLMSFIQVIKILGFLKRSSWCCSCASYAKKQSRIKNAAVPLYEELYEDLSKRLNFIDDSSKDIMKILKPYDSSYFHDLTVSKNDDALLIFWMNRELEFDYAKILEESRKYIQSKRINL